MTSSGLRNRSPQSIQVSPANDVGTQHLEYGVHVAARTCGDEPLGHAAQLGRVDISAPIYVGVDATSRATCKLSASRGRALDDRRHFEGLAEMRLGRPSVADKAGFAKPALLNLGRWSPAEPLIGVCPPSAP